MLLAAVLLATGLVRIHRMDVPFERDEGEYAYIGQVLLDGGAPFVDAYTMKLPGTHYVFAGVQGVFGRSEGAVRLGLLLANMGGVVLVFALTRRLFGSDEAVLAGATFAALSVGPGVLGLFAHATQFLVTAALLGLWLMLLAGDRAERGRPLLVASGAALSAAFLMKQHGAAFVALGALLLLLRARSAGVGTRALVGDLAAWSVGVVLPLAAVALHLGALGALPALWHWAFEYASAYTGLTSAGVALQYFLVSALPLLFSPGGVLWIAAAGGAALLVRGGGTRPARIFVAALFVFSAAAVSAGFYFRPHYWVMLLPAVSLLAGVGLAALARRIGGSGVTPALTLAVLLVVAWGERGYLLLDPSETVSHEVYIDEFFPEMRTLARTLGERADPGDHVAVVGSEPEVYFYSGLPAATGFLYMYPLMETHRFTRPMQEQIVREIESNDPRYVVYVHVPNSWGREQDSRVDVLRWFGEYRRRYRIVGLADLEVGGRSDIRWREQGGSMRPRSETWAAVYERRPGAL